MHILITRPEPDATSLAKELIKSGHQCTLSPLLNVKLLDKRLDDIQNAQGLIITSQNALRAIKDHTQFDQLTELPVYIVGPQTADAAKTLGFSNIKHTAANAENLSRYIRENCPAEDGPLHTLTGTHLAFDMVSTLENAGFKINRTIIYQTEPVAEFTKPALANLQADAIDAVVLLSPRTARQYAKLINQNDLTAKPHTIIHYCLSQNIANQLDQLPGCIIRIPSTSDMHAMRSLIEQNKSKLS